MADMSEMSSGSWFYVSLGEMSDVFWCLWVSWSNSKFRGTWSKKAYLPPDYISDY